MERVSGCLNEGLTPICADEHRSRTDNSKSEIQGPLHCGGKSAASGRDDMRYGGRKAIDIFSFVADMIEFVSAWPRGASNERDQR